MTISSRQHPLIKLARALHSSKGRRENGLFLIEGRNTVQAALDAGWPLREVLATPNENDLSPRAEMVGHEVRLVDAEVLSYASEAQNAMTIMAIGVLPMAQPEVLLPPSLLVIDGVADPGNVGTLWRSADAAGISGVLCGEGTADPFSPKVVRSAAGSLFHLPPMRIGEHSTQAIIGALKEQNIPIITAEAHGGQSCFDFAWPESAALVLGHETRGISPEFAEAATTRVNIPVYGRAESLNVAMAGTLLMYAWAKAVQ